MVVMDSKVKYRSDYEYFPSRQMYYQQVKYHFSQERFVVPWQMEDSTKEMKKKNK
jgi:hypothetical protein